MSEIDLQIELNETQTHVEYLELEQQDTKIQSTSNVITDVLRDPKDQLWTISVEMKDGTVDILVLTQEKTRSEGEPPQTEVFNSEEEFQNWCYTNDIWLEEVSS